MECPHLIENAQIDLSSSPFQTPSRTSTKSDDIEGKNSSSQSQSIQCSACEEKDSLWICLTCGAINCGRYVKGHAKEHFEKQSELHCVNLDIYNLFAFCYKCDEYVVNDTSSCFLEKCRSYCQKLPKRREEEEEDSEESTSVKRVRSDTSENDVDQKRKRTESKARKPRTAGLRNLGNTCFMNAVLQSLSNIQEFCGYIKQLPSLEEKVLKAKKVHISRKTRSNTETDEVLLVEELRKTLVALWCSSKGAISPESLFSVIWKVVPRFRGYQQQDAHEFMRYLLDRLHIELLELLPYPNNNSPYIGPKGKSTIVTAIFGGLLQSEVNCLICSVESKKHDPFLDLSLDIPPHFSSRTTKAKEDRPICTLSDCLSSFTDVEELEDSELYMCNNCKKRQKSTKKFWIRRLPNVLCLHLKRFRWSLFNRLKVETYVEFPIHGLDMNKYILNNLHETRGSSAGSNLYDLAAVIVHHGSGAGSGHYTAYATHEGQWYHFNDSTVTACNVDTVTRTKAYILFYVRREIRLPDSLCVRAPSSINGHRQLTSLSKEDLISKDISNSKKSQT